MSFVLPERRWSKLHSYHRCMKARQRKVKIMYRIPPMVKEMILITLWLMSLDGLDVKRLFPRRSRGQLGSHCPLNTWRYFILLYPSFWVRAYYRMGCSLKKHSLLNKFSVDVILKIISLRRHFAFWIPLPTWGWPSFSWSNFLQPVTAHFTNSGLLGPVSNGKHCSAWWQN